MLKRDELRSQSSCLNKAEPDEPVFVLRAKDPLAAQTVRLWAAMADDVHEPEKRVEAMALAEQMEQWRKERQPPAAAVFIEKTARPRLG
jgi:hypothetical protein